MKQIIGNYSFSTSAKTVTLSDFTTIRLDRIKLIIDATTNKILYNFADSSVATATVATNVITLSALQGGENNTDKLIIFYDTVAGDPVYDVDYKPSSGTITVQDTGSSSTTGQNSASIITGSPTANSTQSLAINGRPGTRIQISGTWTGTLQFEISIDGGTTWSVTTSLVSGTAYRQSAVTGNGLFFVDTSGSTNVRVRATAAMTGTATILMVSTKGPGIVKNNQPQSIVDNSSGNQLVIDSSGRIATNEAQVAGATMDTNSGTKSAGTQRVVLATDQPQLSNKLLVTPDSVALPNHQSTNVDQLNGTTIDTNSGTKSAGTQRMVLATDQPNLTTALNVQDASDGTVSAGSAASKSSLSGLVYNTSAPAPTNGQQVALQGDSAANLMVTLASLIAGEDLTNNVLRVEQHYSYSNVTATGTTTVKSGAGFLQSISINNPMALTSATTATTIKIYDNTAASGTLIATFSLPISANLVTALPFHIPFYDVFSTGLTLSITLGTSGSWTPDITVNYR